MIAQCLVSLSIGYSSNSVGDGTIGASILSHVSTAINSEVGITMPIYMPALISNDELMAPPTPSAKSTKSSWVRPIPTASFQRLRTPSQNLPNCTIRREEDSSGDTIPEAVYSYIYDERGRLELQTSDINADGDLMDVGDSKIVFTRHENPQLGTLRVESFTYVDGSERWDSSSVVDYRDDAIIRFRGYQAGEEAATFDVEYSYDQNGLLRHIMESEEGWIRKWNYLHNERGQRLYEWQGEFQDPPSVGEFIEFTWGGDVVSEIKWIRDDKVITRNVISHNTAQLVTSDFIDSDGDGPMGFDSGFTYEYGENGWVSVSTTIRSGEKHGETHYFYEDGSNRLLKYVATDFSLGTRTAMFKYSCRRSSNFQVGQR